MTAGPAPRNFRKVLRDALDQRQLKNKAFADMVGVSENTVSNWTRGQYQPNHARTEKIADLLGLTIDELHGRVPARSIAQRYAPAVEMTDAEAQRIVSALASLDVNAEAALDTLQRVTPPLIEILAAARKHAAQMNGGS
ncbi:MAG: helix-turn-helix transcriptional regulator [Solirubrobacteraceae bacterium]